MRLFLRRTHEFIPEVNELLPPKLLGEEVGQVLTRRDPVNHKLLGFD